MKNVILFLTLFIDISAHAASSYQVNHATSTTISEWSSTKIVINNHASNDYFVPTNTSAEWTAFINNPPSGVTIVNGALSVAGASIWLEADAIAGISNGSPISTWPDSSGSGNSFAAGTLLPTYVTNVYNSKPAVRFVSSGGGGMYMSKNIPTTVLGTNPVFSLFMVVNAPLTSSNYQFWNYGDVANNNPDLWLNQADVGGGYGWNFIYSTPGYGTFKPGAQNASVTLLEGIKNSSNDYYLYRTGTSLNQSLANPASSMSASYLNMYIGGNPNSWGATNNLDICEFIVYPTALNTSDRQIIEGYLAWKYGFQASLPGGHPYFSSPPP